MVNSKEQKTEMKDKLDLHEIVIYIEDYEDARFAIDFFKQHHPEIKVGSLPKPGHFYGINNDDGVFNLSWTLPSIVKMKEVYVREELTGDLRKIYPKRSFKIPSFPILMLNGMMIIALSDLVISIIMCFAM